MKERLRQKPDDEDGVQTKGLDCLQGDPDSCLGAGLKAVASCDA